MTGPQDPAVAGGGQLRAGHADREQVVRALKDAFTQGRLTEDELDARTGQALAARTYAELDAVTVDLPDAPRLDGPPAVARRWPLVRATVKSGGCVVIAAVLAYSGNMIDNSDPNGTGPGPHHGWTRLLLLLTLTFLVTAFGILANGVATSVEQRRLRRQLPPGPGGHTLDREPRGGTGHDPAPSGPRTDQTRTDQTHAELRVHMSRRRRRLIAQAGRAPRGRTPAPGAV